MRSEVASPSLSVRLCLRDQVKSISVSLRFIVAVVRARLVYGHYSSFRAERHGGKCLHEEGSLWRIFPFSSPRLLFSSSFHLRRGSLCSCRLTFLFIFSQMRLRTRENIRARMHSPSPWDAPRTPSLACRFGSASYV